MPPPEDAEIINIVDDTSHQSAAADLMRANGLVDLLIPRGGGGTDPGLRGAGDGALQSRPEPVSAMCMRISTPICKKALDIIVNAKTSRPSVCNAEEVCLVHQAVAEGVPAHAEAGAGG